MSDHLDTLLDELAGRLARGEALDLPGLLARAGDDADRLAELADRLLEAAPRREPTPEDAAYIVALEDPPLLRLRLARRLKRGLVVTMLAKHLAISDAQGEERLTRYYARLEGALLDPRWIDSRVWLALESILGADARARAFAARKAQSDAVAYFRARPEAETDVLPAAPRPQAFRDPPPAERDELDILFLGTA